MKANSDKRILNGYMTAFLLLFFSYILTFYTAEKLREQSLLVSYTNSLINNFDYLLSGIKDAQRGSRGYFIVGDSIFLSPHRNSYKTVDSAYDNLKILLNDEQYATAINQQQYKRLIRLQNEIKNEYAIIEGALNSFRQNNFKVSDSIVQFEYRNKSLMDHIDNEIRDIQRIENNTMRARIEQLEHYITTLQIINITSLIIAVLLSGYSIFVFNKESTAKHQADEQAAAYRNELEDRVKELHYKNEEINRLRSIEKFAATGRIARTIAHEVRNPLTNINLATEQLQEEVPRNDETELLMRMIDRNTARINQLITDLLNSTKFAQLIFTKASLHYVLDEALNMAKDRIELKNVNVNKQYGDSLPDVNVDVEKMKIAFLNLIMNAIEAMEEGKGILTIATEKNKDKCIIRIQDNGAGIDEEHMLRIFEPYFTSKAKGSGLGLTNTQNIILNHKGIIYAKSEPGEGSTFIVELDCA
ncbi:GHKL domain-containing protein [Ilyomonas limi]|uniref:histidine kinase n=1 Tax=Ilyomonas limi TaxID=2575867 RepID=A0A4U3LBX6_9BACT|nr:ATP-binding protein [Ilyomonas limi]TKK71556.1 GHKL domain-containing protein [Ilyomonas limi]